MFSHQFRKCRKKLYYKNDSLANVHLLTLKSLTRDAVHYNQRTISNAESSRYFRGEVNVSWWVNQIDQEAIAILGLLNEGQIVVIKLIEQGDGATSKNIISKQEQTAIAKNLRLSKGNKILMTIMGSLLHNTIPCTKDNCWRWWWAVLNIMPNITWISIYKPYWVIQQDTYVDLMVMQRSCSSLRVSVKRVSPARADAMIPAFDTSESVKVDFPWSTCAITDMLRMLAFLSMMARTWSTVKFT